MAILDSLILGFSLAVTPLNLCIVVAGCTFGTLVGALPGLGPVNGVAILLPIAYSLGLEPASALMLLAGVYYGAEYGGRISSILLNIPGDAGAVMTTVDGHPMAQQGLGGRALGLSALASFVGALLALVSLTLIAPWLSALALVFGPAEYVALMVFAFVSLARVVPARRAKTAAATALGLLLACVGIDSGTGIFRFTLDTPNLFDGVDFLVVIIGLFAISECFVLLARTNTEAAPLQLEPLGQVWREAIKHRWTAIRASIVGFFVGLLPGTGASIASTIAYGVEQRIESTADDLPFGQGNPRGLVAPEAANNAAAVGAMVPMLTLGLPGSATTAVMLGALLMYSVTPGPLLFIQRPDIAWGLICSMFIGNLVLLLLNLPLVGWFARLLSLHRSWLIAIVLVFAFAGVYSVHGDQFDLVFLVLLGTLGYVLRSLGFPLVPLILGYVLGGLLEDNLRRALSISDGDWWVLWSSWTASGFWLAAVLLLSSIWWWPLMQRRLLRGTSA